MEGLARQILVQHGRAHSKSVDRLVVERVSFIWFWVSPNQHGYRRPGPFTEVPYHLHPADTVSLLERHQLVSNLPLQHPWAIKTNLPEYGTNSMNWCYGLNCPSKFCM